MINEAMTKLFHAGAALSIAAGNENQNCANVSPASALGAFTVGATDRTDAKASYSNWGECVQIHAPGTAITSLWVGKDGETKTISGTSMATPHVAGVMASVMSEGEFTSPQQVYDAMKQLATRNVISGLTNSTVNALVFNGKSEEAFDVPSPPATIPDPLPTPEEDD